jgi:hypothetical protein
MHKGGVAWNGRSSSLWFCDVFDKGRFAWYEVAFMESPFSSSRASVEPFAMSAAHTGDAFSPLIMGAAQVATDFEQLDRSDLSEFVNQWLGWFGDAAEETYNDHWFYPKGRFEEITGGRDDNPRPSWCEGQSIQFSSCLTASYRAVMTDSESIRCGRLALSHTVAASGRLSGRSPHGCGRS